jgi:hypothetical protein
MWISFPEGHGCRFFVKRAQMLQNPDDSSADLRSSRRLLGTSMNMKTGLRPLLNVIRPTNSPILSFPIYPIKLVLLCAFFPRPRQKPNRRLIQVRESPRAAQLRAGTRRGSPLMGIATVIPLLLTSPAHANTEQDSVVQAPKISVTLANNQQVADGLLFVAPKAAGISGGTSYGHRPWKAPFNEADWTELNGHVTAYIKSKSIAERAAWDFIARERGDLELSVINPVGVLGPVLGPDYSTSILLVQRLLDGAMPRCPKLYFGVVDVRDVADIHLRAMTDPAAKVTFPRQRRRFYVNARYRQDAKRLLGRGC